MRLIVIIVALLVLSVSASQVSAVTMTFDDIPEGRNLSYYDGPYNGTGWGIGWQDAGFHVEDHTGSVWGPPHSGKNVLVWSDPGYPSLVTGFMLKRPWLPHDQMMIYASFVGGYFSTEMGTVLEMKTAGPDGSVQSAIIGAPGESWNNVYVQINSPMENIYIVTFNPVTADALSHFCVDDLTVNIVPEPSSLIALTGGLVGFGSLALRRKNIRINK